MIYSKQIINTLTRWIADETSAYNTLKENNLDELVILKTAIFGDEKSFNWLVKNKKTVLTAFVRAVRDDHNAFKWLMENKHVVWGATANAINSDKNADSWLRNNGFEHFIELSEEIEKKKFKEEQSSDIDFLIKSPFG